MHSSAFCSRILLRVLNSDSPVEGSNSRSAECSSAGLDDAGCCMLVAMAHNSAVQACWVVVREKAASGAAAAVGRSLLDMVVVGRADVGSVEVVGSFDCQ